VFANDRRDDVKVERALRDVIDHEQARFEKGTKLPAEACRFADELRRVLLESDVEAALAVLQALDEEP